MNRKRIYRKGRKQSPASPANRTVQAAGVPFRKVARSHTAPKRCPTPTSQPPHLATFAPDQRLPLAADPVILWRLCQLLAAIKPTLVEPFSATWLAQAMSRVDGGPVLDPPRLGPSLRQLGFAPVRRRCGARRVTLWLSPGAARPLPGRPHGRPRPKQWAGDKNER